MTDCSALDSTISGLQRSLKQGKLSVAEALAHQARQLAVLAPAYQCVVHAHELPQQPRIHGPLAGIGLAHKDIFETDSRRPAVGSARCLPGRPRGNARAVEYLAQAGASNLAALAMAEFACGATGENPNGPEPVNPLDPAAVVGGSSSGSAVAVSAGLCYASLGTDTAGSVRIPAATCAVVGLKPTYDLISRSGVFPLASALDSVGILARSAADVALVPALPRGIPDRSAVHTRSPQFDPRELSALYRWMPFVNYLGFPAIVFPVGFDRRNRPVSIQAIARPYDESTLLSFAYQIERARHGAAGFPAGARRVS